MRRKEEDELIQALRKEAYDVKQCFTQYSFQGISLVLATLSLSVQFNEKPLLAGLIGIPLTLVLILIAQIGTHKMHTANRLNGYELHIQRIRRYCMSGAPGWRNRMRDIGWEEALRAWRIVQPTVFEYLYVYGNLRHRPRASGGRPFLRRIREFFLFWTVDRLRKSYMNSRGEKIFPPKDKWFETRSHLEAGMSYFAGGYLRTILSLVNFAALICVAIVLMTIYRMFTHVGSTCESKAVAIVISIVIYGIFGNLFKSRSRRILLEEGFLSINSCAVMWQITVHLHFVTLAELADGDRFVSYKMYSRTLGKHAKEFADNVFNLYEWYARELALDIDGIPPKFDSEQQRVV